MEITIISKQSNKSNLFTLVKFQSVFQLLYKYQKGHSATLEMPEGPQRNYILGKKKIAEEDE